MSQAALAGPLMLGLAGVAVGGVGWGAIEARAFTLRHVRVPLLPRGSAPLRVLHLSDIHLVPSQRSKLRWLRELADVDPDLVINTGDNLGHPGAVGPLRDALEPLLKRPGAFVHGSNDYFGPTPKNPFTYFRGPTTLRSAQPALPWETLTEAFVASGWLDLRNARQTVEIAGIEVDMVGLDDPHIERDRMPPVSPRASTAEPVRLGVVHAPYARVLEALRADGAALVLAGHTHGGQVRVPGFGALVTNCDLSRRRARGLSGWPGPRPDHRGGEQSMWLHVSAGVGTSPYARVRFACRPEATLLELVPIGA